MGTGALATLAAQAAFRVLLDTLAHPGRVGVLDVPVGIPAPLLLPLALADPTQRVAVVGNGGDRWQTLLVAATSCRITTPDVADLVVALDGAATPALVAGLRRGWPESPEQSARVAIGCSFLGDGCAVVRRLRGPGINGTIEIGIDGLRPDVLDAIATANAGFPAGIDVWLVADDGAIVGWPRSAVTQPTEEPRWAT